LPASTPLTPFFFKSPPRHSRFHTTLRHLFLTARSPLVETIVSRCFPFSPQGSRSPPPFSAFGKTGFFPVTTSGCSPCFSPLQLRVFVFFPSRPPQESPRLPPQELWISLIGPQVFFGTLSFFVFFFFLFFTGPASFFSNSVATRVGLPPIGVFPRFFFHPFTAGKLFPSWVHYPSLFPFLPVLSFVFFFFSNQAPVPFCDFFFSGFPDPMFFVPGFLVSQSSRGPVCPFPGSPLCRPVFFSPLN